MRLHQIEKETMVERFWADDPVELISSSAFLPKEGMDPIELLNVMSRLIIVMALLMMFLSVGCWWVFLLVGLGLMCLIWYSSYRDWAPIRVEHFKRRPKDLILMRIEEEKVPEIVLY